MISSQALDLRSARIGSLPLHLLLSRCPRIVWELPKASFGGFTENTLGIDFAKKYEAWIGTCFSCVQSGTWVSGRVVRRTNVLWSISCALSRVEDTHVSWTSSCLTSSGILSSEDSRMGMRRVWVGAMRTGTSSRSATDNEGERCVELEPRHTLTIDQYPSARHPKSRH
jgi:hypothetical protein